MALVEQQKEFAAHLRDPENVPAPGGLDDRRLGVYRELVFNNVESLMANNFPVINALMDESIWLALIREFLRDYRSTNPYFPRLGREFIEFLSTRESGPQDLPFLLELAHYENIEFDLFMEDDDKPDKVSSDALHANSIVSLPATAKPLAYQYPVHRIAEQWQPAEAPELPTFLLVFQDKEGSVRFFELQLLSYQLLVNLQDNDSLSLSMMIKSLADEVRENDPGFTMDDEVFFAHAIAMLKQFQDLGVLRLTKKSSEQI